MRELEGKKLLILGASAYESFFVRHAKRYGIYTIVTDWYTDRRVSQAKNEADEAWDVSWSDLDTLERLCREKGVNGVIAGYSEFRVENMIKLCGRLGLPCYCTEEQLEITRDKAKFKELCRRNGVPTVREYASPDEVDAYPVIVKPVDRGGSIGVSVATNREELDRAVAYGKEMSVCGRVIIEKFIEGAGEYDVHYFVHRGIPEYYTTVDTLKAAGDGYERVVPSAWFAPSKREDAYLGGEVDLAARRMIADLGVQYGDIFFSGFADPAGNFTFFECAFRTGGAVIQEYQRYKDGQDCMDMLICHALTGDTALMEREPEGRPDLKGVVLNLYAKAGVIGEIGGLEEIRRMEDCTLAMVLAKPGDVCDGDKAILRKLAMFTFCHEDTERLRADAEAAYRLFSVTDRQGRDLIYDRIDCSVIPDWWKA